MYKSEKLNELSRQVRFGCANMHPYQHTAVEFLKSHPKCALFIDLGMGKTVSSLTAAIDLWLEGEINHILVIAPKRVANDTWPSEVPQWAHTVALRYRHVKCDHVSEQANEAAQIHRKTLVTTRGSEFVKSEAGRHEIEVARIKGGRVAMREIHKRDPRPLNIITRDQIEFVVKCWGKHWPYDCVIIDESDSLKSHTTARFKAMRSIMPMVKYMWQLTATPAAESYLNLFAQMYLLDGGERLGKNLTSYKETYFDENKYSFTCKLKPGAETLIAEKISDITLTMKAEDYLPKQEAHYIFDRLHLPESSMTKYRDMEKHFVINLPEFDDVEVEAVTAAALCQKLLQLASGILYDSSDPTASKSERVIYDIHSEKIEQLKVIQSEAIGENLLVAYWHNGSLAKLKKAFPEAVLMGETPDVVDRWNKGKIKMLLVHPDSAAHGLNLQHGGRRLVIYDMFWSNGKYLQLVGRLKRQGQKKVVMIHHLVSVDTIDEVVLEVMKGKRDAQELLFKLLKEYRKGKK